MRENLYKRTMPYVKINDVNLYYKIVSKAELTEADAYLVVLHGGPGVSDHSIYYNFWSQFSDKVHVLFFDMRGHGQSDKGDVQKWNLEQWGNDVFQLCESLKIKNPIVAGISFGGWVALSYALQYQNHPSKLILCNTEACIDNQAQIDMYTAKGGEKAGEIIRKIYCANNTGLWSDYIKYCAPYMSKNPYTRQEVKNIKTNMDLYHKFYQTNQHQFNYLNQLSLLNTPTLIIGGTEDPEHPLRSTKAMSSSLPRRSVKIEIIEGAGDPVYRDDPEKVKEIIYNFIEFTLYPDKKF